MTKVEAANNQLGDVSVFEEAPEGWAGAEYQEEDDAWWLKVAHKREFYERRCPTNLVPEKIRSGRLNSIFIMRVGLCGLPVVSEIGATSWYLMEEQHQGSCGLTIPSSPAMSHPPASGKVEKASPTSGRPLPTPRKPPPAPTKAAATNNNPYYKPLPRRPQSPVACPPSTKQSTRCDRSRSRH